MPRFVEYAFETPALRRLVRAAWGQSYAGAAEALPGLIAPDAHIEIVFQVGAPCRIASGECEMPSPPAMLYGLRHGAQQLRPAGDNRMVALRLAPAVASALLRSGLTDCWDRPVPLGDLIGAEADDLLDAIAAVPLEAAGGVLEAWLLSRLRDWGSDHARQVELQARLFWDVADQSVGEVAESVGVTARTLRRHCQTHAGLSPKQLVMSGRMLRACDLLRRQGAAPLVEVAGQLGFSDQSAFTNAFRHYLGMTPTALRAEPLVFYETRD